MLYIIIYTSFPIIYSGVVLFCVSQVSEPFKPRFDPWVYLDSLRTPFSWYAYGRKKEQKNVEPDLTTVSLWWMPRSVVSSFPTRIFVFSQALRLPSSYYSIITCGCSSSRILL